MSCGQLKLVCSSERVRTFVTIFQMPSQERPHWDNGGSGMGKTAPWLGLLSYAHLLLLYKDNPMSRLKDEHGAGVHGDLWTFPFLFRVWPHWTHFPSQIFTVTSFFNWLIEVRWLALYCYGCQGPGSGPHNSGSSCLRMSHCFLR